MSFPPLTNDLILRAARGEQTERAPVWVMRQAGRYLPEFREVRQKHDFFEVCRTPELACEVTLQPIRRYAGLVDAAIIFSDILVVPQALGMTVIMDPGHGPVLPEPLEDPSHMSRLSPKVDVKKELGYVMEAITLTRQKLNGQVPLIGFSGAPWTLMAYMIEGGGSKSWIKAKTWLFRYPKESHELLKKITDVCIEYLIEQILAGAQLVQLFDTWAAELTPNHFAEFALPTYIAIQKGIRAGLQKANVPCPPLLLYAKGANHAIEALSKLSGWDVLGLDWVIDPIVARSLVADRTALQGNADPSILYGGKEAIELEVKRLAAAFAIEGKSKGHIFNLGHGITPAVDPEDLRWFFECVHKYTKSA
ncbi:uroporphyrinogen decarboxylase [Clavulina sp. PMI_390]|nr:uroporphyrinogen decarboxylase [Clavulina sp. PMI_390]